MATKRGVEQGKLEGKAEGKAEGERLNKIDNARKMRALGLTEEQIEAVTGLKPADY